MTEDVRYVLVEFSNVTQEMIDACIQTSFDTLRHVRFENDATDWVVLKWRGDKPEELWNEFPVHNEEEMREILKNDLNNFI